jgi:hypothetical protein
MAGGAFWREPVTPSSIVGGIKAAKRKPNLNQLFKIGVAEPRRETKPSYQPAKANAPNTAAMASWTGLT